MKKKKVIKKHIYSTRFFARVFVLNIPTLLILGFLVLKNEISLQSALLFFLGALFIVAIIAAFVFNELENVTNYFRNLSLGIETDVPRLRRGLFSPFRLLDSFLALKNLWSEQTLSDATILENLPDPLLMMDEAGTIVFSNRIAKDFFGECLIGTSFFSLSKDEELKKAFLAVAEQKQQARWLEINYEDTQSYTFQIRIERLPAQTKTGAKIVCVMHDITPFKLFKQQQSDFFSNASHELKTPLSILSGVIETLQGPAKNDEAAREKFLKMMAEQTTRMTRLVQDLLTLSKLQKTSEETPHEDVILIQNLLKSVAEDLKIKAESNGQTLVIKQIHDLPRLMGNHAQLHQVFQNLIDNAIKYGAENSQITITTQLKNGFPKKSERSLEGVRQIIAVSIHNTGNPIPPRHINRLFERFYRLDTLKSRLTEGTGLGLGIAQQIVFEHDGMIDVASSREKGTVFTVYLPLAF